MLDESGYVVGLQPGVIRRAFGCNTLVTSVTSRAGKGQIASGSVLSPMLATRTPSLLSTSSNKFAIGVCGG